MQFYILPSEGQFEEKQEKTLTHTFLKVDFFKAFHHMKKRMKYKTYLDGSFPHNPGKSDSWQLGVFIS